ncbi:MAG: hypothetical protein WCP62_07555, partial [Planctomycetota bacterium]
MKTQPNGAEITSEDHALAAAILADIPYVVTHPPAIKKDKSKSKKVPRELSAEVASPSSTSPAIAVPAAAVPAAAAPAVAA